MTKPTDFVCCTSELDLIKDIGAIEVLQLLLLLSQILYFYSSTLLTSTVREDDQPVAHRNEPWFAVIHCGA